MTKFFQGAKKIPQTKIQFFAPVWDWKTAEFLIFSFILQFSDYVQGQSSAKIQKYDINRRIHRTLLLIFTKIRLTIIAADGTLSSLNWLIFSIFGVYWAILSFGWTKNSWFPLGGQFCAENFIQLCSVWNHQWFIKDIFYKLTENAE